MLDADIAKLVRFAANADAQISAAEAIIGRAAVSAAARERWAQIVADHRWALRQIEKLVPDLDLRRAYSRSRTSEIPTDMGAFWAEIERRGLDV